MTGRIRERSVVGTRDACNEAEAVAALLYETTVEANGRLGDGDGDRAIYLLGASLTLARRARDKMQALSAELGY